jgi:hypothetical protein
MEVEVFTDLSLKNPYKHYTFNKFKLVKKAGYF